jgi:hypothetical protein
MGEGYKPGWEVQCRLSGLWALPFALSVSRYTSESSSYDGLEVYKPSQICVCVQVFCVMISYATEIA